MGSCISNKQQILVNISKETLNSFPHKTQTSPTNVSNLHKPQMRSSSSDCKYPELLSKANSFDSKIINNIKNYKSQIHHKQSQILSNKNKILKHIITSQLSKNIICVICNDILLHPKHCTKCNLFVCEHCFNETNHNICEHVEDTNINNYYLSLNETLMKLTFKCFSYENGCDVAVEYKDMYYDSKVNEISSHHYETCKYAPKKEHCLYLNCGFSTDNMNIYKKHIVTCKHKEFRCLICSCTVNAEEVNTHKCVIDKKKMLWLLPLRLCKCGKELKWIGCFGKEDNMWKLSEVCQDNRAHCIEEFYYYCSQCEVKYCSNHMSVPVVRVCGCLEKLKGGIIEKCLVCFKEGGIGWRCTLCERGNEICETCLDEFNELTNE